MSIGILADLKTTLGIPSADTTQDTLLTLLLGQVSDLAEDWIGRTFAVAASVTEIYSGNGRSYFALNQRPVTSITSLWLDDSASFGTNPAGAFSSTTLLVNGTDYNLVIDQPGSITMSNSGLVQRIGDTWPEQFTYTPGRIGFAKGPPNGNIKVAYVAGAVAPSRLCMAVYQEVALIRSMGNRGQLTSSESYGDGAGNYSVGMQSTKGIGVLSPVFLGVAAKFRNVAVA